MPGKSLRTGSALLGALTVVVMGTVTFTPNGGGSGPVGGNNAAVPCGFGNNQCKNNS